MIMAQFRVSPGWFTWVSPSQLTGAGAGARAWMLNGKDGVTVTNRTGRMREGGREGERAAFLAYITVARMTAGPPRRLSAPTRLSAPFASVATVSDAALMMV